MSTSLPKTRLYMTKELSASLKIDAVGAPAHYLAGVLRLTRGDVLGVFNGRDGEWLARINSQGKGRCELTIERQLRPQRDEPGPWLLFAPIKKTGVDFVIEKATELGVSRLWPVFTQHTQSARVNLDRLRSRAIEAAEQCRRLTIPDIAEPIALDALESHWPRDRRLIVMDERGEGRPLAEIVHHFDGSPAGMLVGPEGGFATSELDALAALPFVTRASLGPRILRAETAAIAALVCWQALAGDWNQSLAQ